MLLVLKWNGKVRLCLDMARLHQTLIWPVHSSTTLNNIFPKLTNIKYLSLTEASSRCHNLRLDEQSSYLTKFTCQFDRYRYKGWYMEQPQQTTCFREKEMKNSKSSKCVWNCWWHMSCILWWQWQSSWQHTVEHDANMQRGKTKIKLRQMSFQVFINPIF